MNDDEMTQAIQVVSALWPYANVEARYVAGLKLMLADLPLSEVLAAVKVLAEGDYPVREAREFPPPPGVVREQVERVRRAARNEERKRRAGVAIEANDGTMSLLRLAP